MAIEIVCDACGTKKLKPDFQGSVCLLALVCGRTVERHLCESCLLKLTEDTANLLQTLFGMTEEIDFWNFQSETLNDS